MNVEFLRRRFRELETVFGVDHATGCIIFEA
jgi:hypothetical protein